MSATPIANAARPQESPKEAIAPYRQTLFDRLGPDAAVVIRARMFGVATAALTLPLFRAVAVKLGLAPSPIIAGLFVLACCLAAGVSATLIGVGSSNFAGRVFGRFTMGGSSTPYKEQYSREQALVMRGEVDAALESFEAIMAERPDAVDPRIKAAELYAKEKRNHRRAAELFREVQRLPAVAMGEDVYVTNRLVDLYTGPLDDLGRAVVELRRLIERYPGSPAAQYARTGLAELKQRLHAHR